MKILKIKIKNFKGFKSSAEKPFFEMGFNDHITILVGDNDSHKSTIIEAVNLVLTGKYNYSNLESNLFSSIFNKDIITYFLGSLERESDQGKRLSIEKPEICIELFTQGISEFLGQCCEDCKQDDMKEGISFKVIFDDDFKSEYSVWLSEEKFDSFPIEFYKVEWRPFNCDSLKGKNENIIQKKIPLKTFLIDSSNYVFKDGANVFIEKYLGGDIEKNDKTNIIGLHRNKIFELKDAIGTINSKLKLQDITSSHSSHIDIKDFGTNDWLSILDMYINNVPYKMSGKGIQSIFKIKMFLSKTKEASLLLIEEIENHLSYLKLQELIKDIEVNYKENQIILSTHNSFVINKLNLGNVVFMNKASNVRFDCLPKDTKNYFNKLSSHDTIKFILGRKTITCEGPSDELIIMKAYLLKNRRVPSEEGVSIVNTDSKSSKRFLDIAKLSNAKVSAVMDRDKHAIEEIKEDYKDYTVKGRIKICVSSENISEKFIELNNETMDNNTLESNLIKSLELEILNKILFSNVYSKYKNSNRDLFDYMIKNKTECAMKIFDYEGEDLLYSKFPQYIKDAIDHVCQED